MRGAAKQKQLSLVVVVVMMSLLMFVTGCDGLIPPRPPIDPPAAVPAESTPATDPGGRSPSEFVDSQDAAESFEGDWNGWYVHRFGSQVVGVTEIEANSVIDPARLDSARMDSEPSELRYERRERLIIRTGDVSFIRRVSVQSDETADGTLKHFQSDVFAGPVSSSIRGAAGGSKLTIDATRSGEHQQRQLDWPPMTRGLFALEQTLRRRPMEIGETRRVSVLMHSLDAVGVIELQCNHEVSVPMIDGDYRLLREIDVTSFQDAKPVDSLVVWVDDQGVIEKSLRPALRLESFRVDRSTANDLFGTHDESEVRVSVAGQLRDGGDPVRLTTLVTSGSYSADDSADPPSEDADAGGWMPPAIAGQHVRRGDSGFEVLVTSETADPEGFKNDRTAPEAVDTAATPLIDIGHASVARKATAIGDLAGTELARELTRLAQNDLSLMPQGLLQPASAVILAGKGGYIDHAVVVAALLRQRKIPARVVFGLSRSNETKVAANNRIPMKLSAWVVASIDGRWTSIDSVTGQFNRVDQICLSRPAGDADLNAALADVFGQIAKIQVQVLDAEY